MIKFMVDLRTSADAAAVAGIEELRAAVIKLQADLDKVTGVESSETEAAPDGKRPAAGRRVRKRVNDGKTNLDDLDLAQPGIEADEINTNRLRPGRCCGRTGLGVRHSGGLLRCCGCGMTQRTSLQRTPGSTSFTATSRPTTTGLSTMTRRERSRSGLS